MGLAFCHMVPESSGIADMTEYGSLNGALILLGIAINLCTERLSIDIAQQREKGQKQAVEESNRISVTAVTGSLASPQSMENVAATANLPNPQQPEASDNNPGEATSKPLRESKDLISAHTVEVGVIVHTVIIGISVGTWNESRASLIVFTIAMAFHQFFEGIGLGTMLSAASHRISTLRTALMVVAFTLSFPASICAGIGIAYTSNQETNELVSGAIGYDSGSDRAALAPRMPFDALTEAVHVPALRCFSLQLELTRRSGPPFLTHLIPPCLPLPPSLPEQASSSPSPAASSSTSGRYPS